MLCISSRATLATKFLSHTQIYKQTETVIFQKYSNRDQDIPKRVNPSKTDKSKILTKPILFPIYIEETADL